jgi:hypothetical protein
MKKTISLFLALVLLMSVFSLVFADEIGEQYYTVKVEYSDNVGKKEQLNLMVQGYNVYVDAKMLAERFGYTFGENGNCAVIFNKDMSNGLPVSISEFEYNSTRVSHTEKALNFDISTGKELTYLDILDGTNAEIDAVLRLYLEKFVYSPTEVQIEDLKQYTAYTLCDDGLCFYYNVGDAVSRQEIVIPYTSEDTYIITVTDLLN